MTKQGPLSGQQVAKRYQLGELLGSGGMGAVYKAQDTRLHRLVAMKVMSPADRVGASDLLHFTQLFQAEALRLASLKYPGIPHIYDHFEEAARWFLVMEFIEGETLKDYLQRHGGRLHVDEVLKIGLSLADVLHYLHLHQPPIIFRDLKPANVMIAPNGQVFLIDFGIARLFTPGKSQDTFVFLSRGYAAPEQHGIAQTTVRSDIYSLGATLHHLLSGTHPASKPFLFAPLSIQQPTQLASLIARMVAIDPASRPASITEVKDALQQMRDQTAAVVAKLINDGDALYNLGRFEEALAAYEQALKVEPNNSLALSGKRESLQHIGRELLAPTPALVKQPRFVTYPVKAGDKASWILPDLSLLNKPQEVQMHVLRDDSISLAKVIQDTLRSFHVDAEVRPEDISIGPTVIRFGIRPTGNAVMKPDEKGRSMRMKDDVGSILDEQRTFVNQILALQNDLTLALEAKSIRMEAPVPGRSYVILEIPNKNSYLVTLRQVLESKAYMAAKANNKLSFAVGMTMAGAVRWDDVGHMLHLVITGTTRSEKSMYLNAIITCFLMQATPEDVRMLMIDPTMVELNRYNGIPHLLTPVVSEVEQVVALLNMVIDEVEKRQHIFSQLEVSNFDGYRALRHEKMAHGDNSLKNLPDIVMAHPQKK